MSGQLKVVNELDVENRGLEYCGLQYFGAMSASIAHEIKNALAITNESAGLLEDLSLISMKNGLPLDSERVARLSKKVMDQIKRADTIVRKMSQFAHSVDEPVKAANLSEIVELAIDLGRRIASTKNINLSYIDSEFPISIETNPFLLMNLLWLIIKSAFERVNSDNNIEIAISKEEEQAQIIIMNLVSYNLTICQENIQTRNIEQEKWIPHLADLLNAKIDMNNEDKILITIALLNGL
ncbi:MAG: HAMP domain-containing histidine kinase [Desulfamplus sp.]|nr:HAMP domain-containing histidine kinase [Desulfamplus sp.]